MEVLNYDTSTELDLKGRADCRTGPRSGPRISTSSPTRHGFTLIELLVVLAVLGVVLGISGFFGRGALERQQQRAAIRSIQQSVWQGASGASARGRNTELKLVGRRIEVREAGSGRLLRTEELPSGVTTSLPTLVFTPPGKISADSFAQVENGITVSSSEGTTRLIVSIIGEVIAEKE